MRYFTSSLIISLALTVITNYAKAPKDQANLSLQKVWETEAVLQTPESVIYDAKNKILYVSNINGDAKTKDGNGFISKLTTDGKVEILEWITGLDAPKGLGIFNQKLYIADLTNIIVADIVSGKIENRIAVEGAVFLNDITVNNYGEVYITDSGNKKVYLLKNNQVSVWLDKPELEKPNGILAKNKDIFLLDMTKGNLYEIKDKQQILNPKAQTLAFGDGIVEIGKDEFIVSNWNGQIYHLNKGVVTTVLDTKEQKKNAADIWYIADQKLLLVPTFFGNTVSAYKLQ